MASICSHYIARSRFPFNTQADVHASPTRMFPPQPFVSAFDALCEVRSDKAKRRTTSPFISTVKEISCKRAKLATVSVFSVLVNNVSKMRA